jgi:hypothetical protein
VKVTVLDDWFDTLRTRAASKSSFADVFDQVNAYAAGAPTNVVAPQVIAYRELPSRSPVPSLASPTIFARFSSDMNSGRGVAPVIADR